MNISPISISHFPKLNKTNNNYKKRVNQQDAFIKNNISFQGGKIAPKFNAFSKEMTQYILNTPQIEKEEVEKIIQKFSPSTTFEELDNFSTNHQVTDSAAGYTKMLQEIQLINGAINIRELPKTIYVNLPETSEMREKLIFNQRIQHEFTHVIQEESKDRQSNREFIQTSVNRSKNFNNAIDTMQALPNFFTEVESNIFGILAKKRN